MRTAREPLSEWFRREVLPRLSLEAVYGSGDGVKWGRAGEWRTRPCPLHGGRNPNFHAHPNTLAWKCWSKCGAEGDAVSFVERKQGLGFVGAVQHLAELVGTVLPGGDQQRPSGTAHRASPPPAPMPRVYQRPPTAEVAALWASAKPVGEVPEAVAYLKGRRGLDVPCIDERDLARVLPLETHLPQWASHWRAPGRDYYRLLIPLFGSGGRLEGLRARPLRQVMKTEKKPKALPTSGAGAGVGLVMADALGRGLLSGERGAVELVQSAELWLAEGEPDFLRWATAWGDSENAPAVLGFVAGAWTQEIADRVPNSCTVVIDMHEDEAAKPGDVGTSEKYARAVEATFRGRRIRIEEWHPRRRTG